MKRWIVLVDLVLVLLALAGAVASYRNGIRTTAFAPDGDVPAFEAVRYAAPWIVLAALLATLAGLLLVDAVARTAAARR